MLFDRSEIPRRLAAAAVAVAAMGLLLVAVLLAPSSDGHGTHTQLGLPTCGWVVAFDTPCPTCGMTTSYAHAVRGEVAQAATTQPMGTALAILTAAIACGGTHAAATGCRFGRFVDTLLSARTLWVMFGLGLLAWGYKLLTWS